MVLNTQVRNRKPDQDGIVTTVGPYDVLCGKSKACFNNVGNRRFRITLALNAQAYMEAKDRQAKGRVIHATLHTLVNENGGRFLQPISATEFLDVTKKQARKKIGHGLRDLSVTMASSMSPLPCPQQSISIDPIRASNHSLMPLTKTSPPCSPLTRSSFPWIRTTLDSNEPIATHQKEIPAAAPEHVKVEEVGDDVLDSFVFMDVALPLLEPMVLDSVATAEEGDDYIILT